MESKIQNERKCYWCGMTQGLEVHHIFGGSRRKFSDQDGLWVYLCHEHHTGNTGVHFDKEFMEQMHVIGQTVYEKNHTREEFMSRYGKNYI